MVFRELSHLFTPAETRNDHGPILLTVCPRCACGQLNLLEIENRIAGIKTLHVLRVACASCPWHEDVPPQEWSEARDLATRCQEFLAGKLERDDWMNRVAESPLAVLASLRALNDEWVCDHCGASSPTTFDVCWTCEKENDAAPSQQRSTAGEIDPRADRAIFGTAEMAQHYNRQKLRDLLDGKGEP